MIAARHKLRSTLGRLSGTLLLLLISVSLVVAQGTDCPAFVEQALDKVSETCAAMGRNQVCYGNTSINARFNSSDTVQFDLPGDHASVLDLVSLTTAPLRPENDTWGVAVLALQANLPANLPGENAIFIVFGDTEVTPVGGSAGYDAPMQAFSLNTRIGNINCQDVPDSGVLVQAPEDTTVNFLINGVEVNVGSSALLQIDSGDLTVDTVEGFVQVTSDGATEVVGEGLSIRVRRGQRPQRAAITRSARVRNAPWRLLPRQVSALPPPPDGQTVNLNQCFYPSAQRAAQNPVTVRAEQDVVLRFSIPHESLDLARIILQQTRTQLSINGEVTPPYTRIGPWRGENDEYDDHFGIEFYWLVPAPAAGALRVVLASESLTGRPIFTGVDGPDADNQPEVIPAQRRIYCSIQVSG